MGWIPDGTVLKGNTVTLLPISETHFEELADIAAEESIWTHVPRNMNNRAQVLNVFAEAIKERERGTQYPFAIYHNEHKKLIGSTRLTHLELLHKKLEIGWTWLHPEYWGTAVNFECKLLLLTFCFETLEVYRVQLKTDEKNIRSRKAIAKIGAKCEGILRNDMIKENGQKRNSVYFSITAEEWPEVKPMLRGLYDSKQTASNISL